MLSKLPQTGDSIFSVMTRLANEHGAMNLAQGFPDFDPDIRLQQLVAQAMQDRKNQYAPMQGLPALREQIALKTNRFYGFLPDANSEITVTAGATQALFTAIMALVHAGDEVILLDPAYDAYAPAVQLSGGIPVRVAMRYENLAFHFDWDAVEKALTPKTRMLLLNHPNNPAGSILQEGDLARLLRIMEKSDLLLLSDEVYEHMVFDGKPFLSVLRNEQLRQRSLVVSSFGKTYHSTGWKIGYVVAPAELQQEFRKVHQFNVFSVNTPMQQAYADYLTEDRSDEQLPAFYEKKTKPLPKLSRENTFSVHSFCCYLFSVGGFFGYQQAERYGICRRFSEKLGYQSHSGKSVF
jgi:methionine aminotransferase